MEKTEKRKMTAEEIISLSLRILLGVIIAVLVFVASVLMIDRLVNKSKIPAFFGRSLLVIATGSMSGTIEPGDAVIIKSCDSYNVGDIITYFPAGDTVSVTHRIVEINGDRFTTKGDAVNDCDPDPVFQTQIVGKTVKILPKLGIVIEWLKTGQGIAFLIAIGAVIVALVAVIDSYDDEEYEEYADDVEPKITEENGAVDYEDSEITEEDGADDYDDSENEIQIPKEFIIAAGGNVETAKRLWLKRLKRNRKKNPRLKKGGRKRSNKQIIAEQAQTEQDQVQTATEKTQSENITSDTEVKDGEKE